ncbi:exonuclease domain-containing protein [Neisseria sp. Ec49-e6-T10]|uniref:3'-5' exonuclease n=1 Tax=Neisseria sp. Ec49-e6-T10 TaxID=3140744 RepID=UPI003EBFA264
MLSTSESNYIAKILNDFYPKIAIVDVESTGGDLLSDRLTEVAVILIEHGQIKAFNWLINPNQPIPPFVAKLTGINDEMVQNQPIFALYQDEIKDKLNNAVILAHNVRFDYHFLKKEYALIGQHLSNRLLCTVKLSKKLYPEFRKHNLDSIIERMSIQLPNRHRALPDAQVLLSFLAKTEQTLGTSLLLSTMDELLYPKKLPISTSSLIQAQLNHLPDCNGFFAFLDHNNTPIFSQASDQLFFEANNCFINLIENKRQEATKIYTHLSSGSLQTQIEFLIWQNQFQVTPEQIGFTVILEQNEQGLLNAHIVKKQMGMEENKTYGYFAHPKAAKKALLECALKNQLCINSLGIVHPTPPLHTPCAQWHLDNCFGACIQKESIKEHNKRVQNALDQLPIKDWGFKKTISFEEKNPFFPEQSSYFSFDQGAILLENGQRFFHIQLLATIKRLLKEKRIKELIIKN